VYTYTDFISTPFAVRAVNNYFENVKGHAFDVYDWANALIEGDVVQGVNQASTDVAAKVAIFVFDVGSALALGRSRLANSVDSASGKLNRGSNTGVLSTIGKQGCRLTPKPMLLLDGSMRQQPLNKKLLLKPLQPLLQLNKKADSH